MMSYLIIGIVCGIAIAQLCMLIYLERDRKKKTDALNQELKDVLKLISDSHNGLVESVAAADKRIGELSLRLDMTVQKKMTTPSMPGFPTTR